MTQEAVQARQKQPPMRKRVERTAGSVGLRLVVGPLRALPLPVTRMVGRGIGTAVFYLLGRYRRVALKNLALVYGDTLNERTRRQMAYQVFRNFGETATEFVKLPQMSRTQVDALVTVDGEEHLKAALSEERGVLLITGHFGNWEFLARWLNLHGYTLNVVARKADDPTADKLLTDTRTEGGAQVYNRGSSARAIMGCLRKKEIVALLPDQNAADVFVPFLGVRTGTVDGPAIIHNRTQAPLLFSWCIRTPDDRFHITFEPPVTIAPTGERAHDIETVTACINARLEAQIRLHPTQWLWLHNRWKATPEVFQNTAASLSSGGSL